MLLFSTKIGNYRKIDIFRGSLKMVINRPQRLDRKTTPKIDKNGGGPKIVKAQKMEKARKVKKCEKHEKHEKLEKREKSQKHEKL